MDIRVRQAREHNLAQAADEESARRHRHERDRLVRALYAEGDWSYRSLAREVGLSKELVALILRGAQS